MNYDDYSNYDLYDEECTGQPPDADQSLIVPRRGLEPDSGPDDEPMIVERRGSPADTDSLVFEEDMDECPDEYLDDCDNLDAVILPYLTGSKPGKKKRKKKHKKKSKKKASASSKGVNLLELAAFVGGGDEDAQFTDGEQESPAKGRFRQPSVCQMEDELLEKTDFLYRKSVLYHYNDRYYESIDAEGVVSLYRQYISPGLDGVKNLRNHLDIYKCMKANPRLKYEDTLRNHFADSEPRREILYNSAKGGYLLDDTLARFLTSSEILAVCKILLGSRSMVKEEMFPILDKLIRACTPLDRLNQVKDLIGNERFHYVEPQHGRRFIESLWEIGTAVENHNVIEITYCRTHDGETRVRTIEPVGILFSEYYFYLAAFIEGIDKKEHFKNPQDNSPTIYRIDRIQNCKTLDRHFAQRYANRFQEGEMRKRIQFMYGGELQTIRFEYTGPSLESVLDRLPTAKVLQVTEKGWIVEAEVFGTGIQMWIRSQGDYVNVISEIP